MTRPTRPTCCGRPMQLYAAPTRRAGDGAYRVDWMCVVGCGNWAFHSYQTRNPLSLSQSDRWLRLPTAGDTPAARPTAQAVGRA